LVIKGVLAGNSPAMIWVDNLHKPGTAFMWDRAHCFYLAGSLDNSLFNRALREFVTDELLPQSVAHHQGVVKVLYSAQEWEKHIAEIFQNISLRRMDRSIYTLEQVKGYSKIPEGCRIARIDEALLSNTTLENIQDVRSEIESCWPSLKRFLNNGFGFCLQWDDEIVCWCTAEYVSEGICGIGIETISSCRGHGFATHTALAFVEYCLLHNITPHWDSWKTNLPSIAVAEKIGFQKLSDYAVYFTLK
jgi:RimJ/RimL family protein N-acetyltransferase